MTIGQAQVIQGNALNLPLPDASVDLICTSPPYFGLRSYQDGGQHYEGQIGSEATPAEFLDALIAATREMVRVLKPTGSIFVNLGDKYAGGRSGSSGWAQPNKKTGERFRVNPNQDTTLYDVPMDYGSIPTKSLMGMPWRYAIRCIDELGLILRAEIIWSKPNGLPESVTDRVRRSHEQWFHFVVQPRYFAGGKTRNGVRVGSGERRYGQKTYDEMNPLGKLPGSVWEIPTQPLTVPPELGVDHFAAYPMEWPRRIIMGWTPNGICTECGEGRRPVSRNTPEMVRAPYNGKSSRRDGVEPEGNNRGFNDKTAGIFSSRITITGYACACLADCPNCEEWGDTQRSTEEVHICHQCSGSGKISTPTAPTTPSVVLDPFGGTGTTALVAKALGRVGVSVDLSLDYCRLAEWRVNDDGELARALGIPKPEPIPEGMGDLFDLLEEK